MDVLHGSHRRHHSKATRPHEAFGSRAPTKADGPGPACHTGLASGAPETSRLSPLNSFSQDLHQVSTGQACAVQQAGDIFAKSDANVLAGIPRAVDLSRELANAYTPKRWNIHAKGGEQAGDFRCVGQRHERCPSQSREDEEVQPHADGKFQPTCQIQ